MAARKRKELVDWVKERLTDAEMREQGKPLVQLAIMHVQGQAEAEFIPPKRINQAKPVTPEELAGYLQDAADTHAQELPGVQYYKIYAFYGDSKTPQGQHTIRVQGQTAPEGGLMTEAPTKEGVLMQNMRWTEADRALIYRQQALLYEKQNQFIEILMTKSAHLMHENTEALNIVKEMMLEKVKLGHEQRIAEVKAVRDADLQRAILKLAPAILHQVSGGRIFPQETADSALLDALAEAVTEDQVKMISMSLPKEVGGLLMARFDEAVKRKMKEIAETKALADEQALKAEVKELQGSGASTAESEFGKPIEGELHS